MAKVPDVEPEDYDRLLHRNYRLKDTQYELMLHGRCSVFPLGPLDKNAVGEYLKLRFATSEIAPRVVSTVHSRSEGNPLFMISVTDSLIDQQQIQTHNGFVNLSRDFDDRFVPATIQQFTELRMRTLAEDELEMLEAASVAGMRFSAASVAAALGKTLEQIETPLHKLAQRGIFIRKIGTANWPDGTSASNYSFVHALYQNVISNWLSDAKRMRLHSAIGRRLETAYSGARDGIAAELAVHFERGGDGSPTYVKPPKSRCGSAATKRRSTTLTPD